MSRFKVGDKAIIRKGRDKGKEITILEVWMKDEDLEQWYVYDGNWAKVAVKERDLDRKVEKNDQ